MHRSPGAAPPRLLLVDAANVVGSRPTGWWRDRAGAAGRLVDQLRAAVDDGRLEAPVVIVLEGNARLGATVGGTAAIRVEHAAGSGDDRLVELTAAAPDPVVVVTADRELRRRVVELGGACVGPNWLYDRMGATH